MANILKVFAFLAFMLCPCIIDKGLLVYGAEAVNQRSLIQLRQDVDTLRNLAAEFREEIDSLYRWRSRAVKFEAEKSGPINSVGDGEATVFNRKAIEESLSKIERRMDILTSGFSAEKATLRERTDAMSQQIQDEAAQILSKLNQTIHDVATLDLFCKDESKKIDRYVSDMTAKIISVERQVLTQVADSESQNMAKIDKLSQSFEQFKEKRDQTFETINRNSVDYVQLENNMRNLVLVHSGWVRNGHSWYKYFTDKMSFDDAQKTCEALGSSLVQGYEKGELEFIVSKFGAAYFWLGATDRKVEGSWRWLNDDPVRERNWDHGQPDNHQNSEDCMLAGGEHGTRWNDCVCSYTKYFVCKI